VIYDYYRLHVEILLRKSQVQHAIYIVSAAMKGKSCLLNMHVVAICQCGRHLWLRLLTPVCVSKLISITQESAAIMTMLTLIICPQAAAEAIKTSDDTIPNSLTLVKLSRARAS
jgi:hypothetical protein